MTLEDIARKLDTIDTSLSTLERKVEDGFSASQIRDEELRRLILLKNVVRQNLTKS